MRSYWEPQLPKFAKTSLNITYICPYNPDSLNIHFFFLLRSHKRPQKLTEALKNSKAAVEVLNGM